MLASILIRVCNATVSGKGRRYPRGWEARTVDPAVVDFALGDACLRAIYQIRRYSNRLTFEYDILRGDSRVVATELERHELSVFSPPYPNSFDYTDVYNIELWTLEYLNSSFANKTLREQTFRNHVQIKRSFEVNKSMSRTLDTTIDNLRQVRSYLWDRDIPEMIAAYFDDMRTVLKALRKRLSSGGRVYMVLGDSRYGGVDVPVARILSEEISALGFEAVGIEPFRSMRASPQQGGRSELGENLMTLRAA